MEWGIAAMPSHSHLTSKQPQLSARSIFNYREPAFRYVTR
uniref:Uncharacterized protein n=1 Tax=Rhizophora mucronata TaxID=61149 RepID=A0A2P2PRN0_RHIMU